MNGTASASFPSGVAGGRWWIFPSLLLFAVPLTAAGAVVGNGSLFIALAPLGLVVVLWAIWIAPLRIPLFWLIFLSLAVDTGEGPGSAPLAWIGVALLFNLNKTFPVEALKLSGVAVILGYLLLVHLHRRLSGSRIDDCGGVGVARPILWGISCSLLTVLALCAYGYVRGGDLQMAKVQVQTYVLLLVLSYLLSATLRGMRDFRVLAAIVVAAACSKALLALYVVNTVTIGTGAVEVFATSHGDSLVFACAFTLVAVRFAEKPSLRNVLACVLLLPLLVGGVLANNRRIAWAEIGAAGIMFFILSRPSRFKRFAVRGLLVALPVVITYIGVGWDSSAKIFAPVRTLRSMQDAEVDRSTLFRDLENFNLLRSMRANPWIGSGLGHPFSQIIQTDDISFFKEYRYMPHNSILGLLGFVGVFGFTGLFMALSVGVLLAARSYHSARAPDERAAAFVVIAMVLIYEIQCWGDIGFSEGRSIFLVGAAIAVAGQLAVSTGAWGHHQRHARTVRG